MIKYLFLVSSLDENVIYKAYIQPFGIDPKEVTLLKLYQDPVKKKTSATLIKEFIQTELKDKLEEVKPKYILVCDSDYFKILTKKTKAEPYLGYVLKSAYSDHNVLFVPNFKSIFYNPNLVKANIKIAIDSLLNHDKGTYKDPGSDIIHSAKYPMDTKSIKECLQYLLDLNKPLTCDIETFSLKHYDAGIGSITFCWDLHNGIAFPVDLNPSTGILEGPQYRNEEVRDLLRWFFENFQNTLMFHNIAFDVYVLIYQLYMKDLLDLEGLNKGMKILLKNWEDTKLITYLATNSCAGNNLSLKFQAQEFAGNYAQEEIEDIRKIKLNELLEYNLVDGLSTWYTYHKHWNNMIQDNQLDIYQNLFKPATVDIIQMQLTGMPLNMDRVKEVKALLEKDQEDALKKVLSNPVITDYEKHLNQVWVDKRNAKLKKKQVTIEEANEKFNPNSDKQLQELLYTFLSLPVIEYTESKQPATGAEVLSNLKNHTTNPSTITLLEGLIDLKAVSKILTAFIPAFENAQKAPDGRYYLFGNLNLGGTVSGRLSSNNPNMQNLPATGSKYAKPIKSCFQAPDGWLFVGLDFASLEDHISALTTKDKNKLKVYLDHYDGHCLRAYAYMADQMPDITTDLNEIKKEGKVFRVTLDNGLVKYYNEFNSEFIKLKSEYEKTNQKL